MLDIIRQRRSVRKFIDREVEEGALREVMQAAMFSPTARGTRGWEFIVIRDGETKKRLSVATPYAAFAKEAPLVLVICHDTNKGKRFKEDCSICAGNIYLEATNQGLGTCFIQIADGTEGEAGKPEDYVRKVLGIPENYRVQCLMPIGYPLKKPEPHKDEEFEEGKIHYERF